ncbi:MAG: S1 RNA-binding domain-containing protein [Geminocystis sp.]|nr:S1 RNA-binding domain-containing protein [Geminocystis sp.]HIK38490.1 S1 RNA-binding domain-containing protein [Geminocystis sp. M7585_C2015_104]MCS7147557.1 S1 RNA-binding domain-containing protein [Geminocystis sp.]MCX8077960.1 S1 RNA-binding domain-containing protein [Geminocystis sp.]MDW8115250.1 S1 RNA-binding domain-containing protein [Geminocystis sp.]
MNDNPHPQASFSLEDFAKALEERQYDYHFKVGEVVRGKVLEYDANGAFVDIGGKCPAFLPLKEATLGSITDIKEILPLGQEFDFVIIGEGKEEGQLKISRRRLVINQAWDELKQIQEKGTTVKMLVTGVNRGGVVGLVNGIQGFIPKSHLLQKENLETLIGQTLEANILQIEPEENKLTLSQKNLALSSAIALLHEREVISGKVTSISPYGVFVDLGNGVTGLLHITQISGAKITSLETLFQPGEEIRVVVMEVDTYKNRVSLSTKILESYPGEFLENKEAVMANAEERLARKKAKKDN